MRETSVNFTVKSGTGIPHPSIFHPVHPTSDHLPPPAITYRNIKNKDVVVLLHYLCICYSPGVILG